MPKNVSCLGVFVFKFVDALWGREAENAILYLYRKALVLASELIRAITALTQGPPQRTQNKARCPCLAHLTHAGFESCLRLETTRTQRPSSIRQLIYNKSPLCYLPFCPSQAQEKTPTTKARDSAATQKSPGP